MRNIGGEYGAVTSPGTAWTISSLSGGDGAGSQEDWGSLRSHGKVPESAERRNNPDICRIFTLVKTLVFTWILMRTGMWGNDLKLGKEMIEG